VISWTYLIKVFIDPLCYQIPQYLCFSLPPARETSTYIQIALLAEIL